MRTGRRFVGVLAKKDQIGFCESISTVVTTTLLITQRDTKDLFFWHLKIKNTNKIHFVKTKNKFKNGAVFTFEDVLE